MFRGTDDELIRIEIYFPQNEPDKINAANGSKYGILPYNQMYFEKDIFCFFYSDLYVNKDKKLSIRT